MTETLKQKLGPVTIDEINCIYFERHKSDSSAVILHSKDTFTVTIINTGMNRNLKKKDERNHNK